MSGWTGFAFTSPLGRILETHVFCCYKPCWVSPQSPCFTHTGRAIGEILRGGRVGQSVSLFLILVHVVKLPLTGSYQTGPSHQQWMRVLALSPAFPMLLTFGILQGSAGKWLTTPSLSTPTPANAKNGKALTCCVCWFPQCRHLHSGQSQPTSMMSLTVDLGRDGQQHTLAYALSTTRTPEMKVAEVILKRSRRIRKFWVLLPLFLI